MTTIHGNQLDSDIHKAYANVYDTMKWLLPDEIEEAVLTRKLLLDRIMSNPQAHRAYSGTKIHTYTISPGCTLCGQGGWSCLFINGICNAHCFYCPTAQDDPGLPMANTIVFDDPDGYADYVTRYHIAGVGFSGGEPLITFDRLL
ncbi:MAG: radical SAM protein, partial [Desulfosarcina sp.]